MVELMATQTLTAYPVVHDVPANLAFLISVFGATEKVRMIGGAGGYHAEVQIGDTLLMIGGGGADVAWKGESRPMAFHIYVPNVDATYQSALGAGAESLQAPTDQEWGERTANVKDPWGNCWYIATFQGADYFSEGAPTVQPFLQPLRAEPVIDFLMNAFDAVELGRATAPDGAILHTTLKLGNSAMELIDAIGIYQPMPGMFYLYVEDADAVYARAVECGSEPISAPADRPYGDRNGSVKDLAGNLWYIASHIAGRT
jgi:PhnB protein